VELDHALQLLEIRKEDYAILAQKYMSDAQVRHNIQEIETEVKKRLDHKDLDMSREEIKKIHVEMITCDAQLDKTVSPME